ncbi:MAG: transposase [Desulfovermiculus sp.]|nr:transposase [Desulfovermiculus sp.]
MKPNQKIPEPPIIPEQEITPLVQEVLDICTLQKEKIALLQETVQGLKDEIARLKKEKPRPKIKPSNLENNKNDQQRSSNQNNQDETKRPGSEKRSKTQNIQIHHEQNIKPDHIPEGSRFNGYRDFVVQDLIIAPYNTKYHLQEWITPSGKYILGKLPEGAAQGHFGTTLIQYILYQYHHAHVTQPLILEQLQEIGNDLSSGQLNNILIENKEGFHTEKADILTAGLEVSDYVNVDDTGARHAGKNGYCTHIGNELFAWFESTDSKARLNFLNLLRGEHTDYMLTPEAFDYMQAQKLPKKVLSLLEGLEEKTFADEEHWNVALNALGISSSRHIRIATEGALIGSILEHGLNKDLVILSDDAGQFNIFLHALCWIHAERHINKLVGFSEPQRQAVAAVRDEIWTFYRQLKAYKENPTPERKQELEQWFDRLFTTKTCFASLNLALEKIYANKEELLLVLKRPEIPLHNNLSENDIREQVKKRKISGGTRSAKGRQCRDTFASLKKTCRKLGISFWQFLHDRLSGQDQIPLLGDCIRQHRAPG